MLVIVKSENGRNDGLKNAENPLLMNLSEAESASIESALDKLRVSGILSL